MGRHMPRLSAIENCCAAPSKTFCATRCALQPAGFASRCVPLRWRPPKVAIAVRDRGPGVPATDLVEYLNRSTASQSRATRTAAAAKASVLHHLAGDESSQAAPDTNAAGGGGNQA